jgi:hypothetical protein
VSTTTEELRIKLLDAKKSETELRAVRRELERTTGQTSSSGKAAEEAAEGHHRLGGALGGLKNALMYGGGLVGLAGVGYGLKDITEGGIQAQGVQARLQQALRATGQYGSRHISELNAAVEKSSLSGGFGALEEKEGLAQLIAETKSSTAAIKLNAAAVTLARGRHMDYGQALQTVERIQTGQIGRLQKYVGNLLPVKYYVEHLTAAEKKRFPLKLKEAELLDREATARETNRRILERYGGQVAAYNKNTEGAISNANNAFKLATEQLGEKLLPAETAVAKGFAEIVKEATEGKGIWGAVAQGAETLGEALKSVWQFFEKNTIALKGLEIGLGILGTVWGISKVLAFASALKELTIITAISKAVQFMAGGDVLLSLQVGALDAAGGIDALGASLGSLLPYAAPIAALVGTVIALDKILPAGDRPENLLGGNQPGENLREGEVWAKAHGGFRHRAAVARATEVARRLAANPAALISELTETVGKHQAFNAAEMQAIKIDLHVDSAKVAEQMLRNPRAARAIAEANVKHIAARRARE